VTTAPDALLLGFARALRAAGMPVTPDRDAGYLEAVATVGMDDERSTYWAGRATLCSGPDDTERYDQIFTEWFSDRRPGASAPVSSTVPPTTRAALEDEADRAAGRRDAEAIRARASATEVLRHRDVAGFSAAEKAHLAMLFASLRRPAPQRRSGRHTAWHRGQVDAHRTLRRQLERLGEPGPLAWRRRATRPRRIVMLIDVSGSMSAYADSFLRLAHHWAGSGRPVEVFTMGTRLTRVTRALRQRDPERALVAAGDVVPDWSGGTRIGESLKAFLDRWGQRGMARGAVVVIFSDGWERGGADVLDVQMGRLRALSHRVVWANPHQGKPGYEPVQQGIAAALPHCHAFVAGHSLQTFDELVEAVGRA